MVILAYLGQTNKAVKIAKLSALVEDVNEVVELLKVKGSDAEIDGVIQAKPIFGGASYLLIINPSV